LAKKVILATLIVIFIALLNPSVLGAERTIRGTITHPCLNKGLSGVLVKAFDSDRGTKDDFMGQAYTNSGGRYTIRYKGGHWDTAPHNVTTWRPDIYITVYMKVNGKWKPGKSSKVHSNHKLKIDLTINLKADYPNDPGVGGGIGTIYGFVKNANNGQPVSAAKLCVNILNRQKKCVNTKPDGAYILNTLPGNCYVLRITAEGYRTKDIPDIRVKPGIFTNVAVKLIPTRSGFTASNWPRMRTGFRTGINTNKPDLTVTALSVYPQAASLGKSLRISGRIKNIGKSSVSTRFSLQFYLSKSQKVDSSSKRLSSRTISLLRANTTWPSRGNYQFTYRLTIPLPRGSYYIGAVADDGRTVSETNENNNSKWVPITIK